MGGGAFLATALAVAVGVAAQIAARRLALPSIVLLLGAGLAVGPDGLGWLDPSVFEAARGDIVGLAVSVILFEGALGLDLERLRVHRRTLLLLLVVGGLTSMAIGTVAARWFVGLSWPVALLYGSLMIVTGPTVVTPLVSRLSLGRPLREVLVSEGVLIDPPGAIVALVVAEFVLGHSAAVESAYLVVARLGSGAVVGTVTGLGLGYALRRRLVPEPFVNPFVLGMALLVSALASGLSAEAGLMAAVALGVTLANSGVRALGPLREFKEELTVVLLGFLFVVLVADVRVAAVVDLGWPALAVVAALAWVARPLAVAVATHGSGFTAGERAFLAWVCPRGVVAASVASLFRILLDEAGMPGGTELEALVFVTVAALVVWQGLTAGTAARVLGADLPAEVAAVIVGANRIGRLLTRTLAEHGREVVLMDASPWACEAARRDGLAVHEGDALSAEALEEAGARHAGTVIALTRNPELNALVAQRVHENFRVEVVLALGPADHEDLHTRPFPGRFPGVDDANALLEAGRLTLTERVVDAATAGRILAELDYAPGEFALVVLRGSGVLIATGDRRVARDDRLLLASPTAAQPSAR